MKANTGTVSWRRMPIVKVSREELLKKYGQSKPGRRTSRRQADRRAARVRRLRARGMSTKEIGRSMGLHHTTVLHYLHRAERTKTPMEPRLDFFAFLGLALFEALRQQAYQST